mgnify:FL=1
MQLWGSMPKRKVLYLAVALVLVVDSLWIVYRMQRPLLAVEAEITLGAHQIVSAEEFQRLPIYDRTQDRWLTGNKTIKDIRKFLNDPDPQRVGPDSVGLFLPLRLSDEGGIETLRRAVSQLAASGICQIALFGTRSNGESIGSILRIQRFRNNQGLWKTCKKDSRPVSF